MFHIFKKNKSAFSEISIPSVTQGEKWAKAQKKAALNSDEGAKTNLSDVLTAITSNLLEPIGV